jgi:hypothetical protein
MQVEALVVKSECVEVQWPRFSKERWCGDSSRSLSKFLQLASNNFSGELKASRLAEIKAIRDREHVTAFDAGCALLFTGEICQAWRKELWQEINSENLTDTSGMRMTNLSRIITSQHTSKSFG